MIDNASTDSTVKKIKEICSADKRVKLIVNTRNFGHIRSPYWGLMNSSGDAVIYLASDLQDPPELIPEFIASWECGIKVVLAVKPHSNTSLFFHVIRKIYYRFLNAISEVEIIKDATGFGLYDKVVIDRIRLIGDPYPYFRGLVSELGFKIKTIIFNQPRRAQGISKNNFYSLYDIAMLGIVSHSLVPIRLASFIGIVTGLISFLMGIFMLVMKLLYWNEMPMGIAPLGISLFFMFGLLLSFIGLLGEYIGSIHSYLRGRPIVVESERVNFD
jgi:dolichol-phosphate mannosyltransferase